MGKFSLLTLAAVFAVGSSLFFLASCSSFQTVAEARSTPVGEWLFSNSANDSSGRGNNGMVVGATPVPDRFGKENNAYAFSEGRYIAMIDTPLLHFSNAVTLSAWVNHDPLPSRTFEDIVMKGNYSFGFQFSQDGQTILFQVRTASSRKQQPLDALLGGGSLLSAPNKSIDQWELLDSHVSPKPGEWYHIVGTYDGATQKIYVNGELKNSATWSGSINTTSEPLTAGYRVADDNNWLNGKVDDIRLYARAISEAEVKDLYHEGGWQ